MFAERRKRYREATTTEWAQLNPYPRNHPNYQPGGCWYGRSDLPKVWIMIEEPSTALTKWEYDQTKSHR